MRLKQKVQAILSELEKAYPDAGCSLRYGAPHELLFAARLSAQCTDERVNRVTPELFRAYPTLEAFAEADLADLERIVRPCGFYREKARNIKDAAAIVLHEFAGRIPNTMEALLRLPGVGRKTANLILGEIYGIPGIVADTHCIRLSNRLGLCGSRDPYRVELQLKRIIPPGEQLRLCHRLVWHGRAVCRARAPLCAECTLNPLCAFALAKAKTGG